MTTSTATMTDTKPTTTTAARGARAAIDREWRTHEIDLGGEALSRLDQDWLLTNATGAFAMGTVPGVNTRRYHGLLIAAARPPVGRIVALNQMFEKLTFKRKGAEKTVEFTSCAFPGEGGGPDTIVPNGHAHLTRFERGLSVAWTYEAEGVTFIRELFLHWRRQAATLRYIVRGLGNAKGARLLLAPMISLRDFHALLHKDEAGGWSVDSRVGGVCVKRGEHAVTFCCDQAARFDRQRDWWYNLVYRVETRRGQDDREDLFIPGGFEVPLDAGADEHVVTFTAALGEKPADASDGLSDARQRHLGPIFTHLAHATATQQKKTVELFQGLDLGSLKRALAVAADDFIVDRTIRGEKLSTIIAGYPWFADWGRDTFIALPGLLLETGRVEEARATLHAFASAIRNGLVPNRFDDYDDDSAHYNTVDASLWFVQAALRYREVTDDQESWNEWLAAACREVLGAYIKGTDFGIRMAGDCLIEAGSLDTQLTWMDAKTGGQVFTPRHGKAVEINALWYAALDGMADAVEATDKPAANHYRKLCARIKRSFIKLFWREDLKHLADHVWTDEQGQEHTDLSLRPNQILAASLPTSPIPQTKQKLVLAAVKKHLLTPRGLRTLPVEHPEYHGRYGGDQFTRDGAYHRGTVWAWLIGPYAEAALRAGKFSDKAKKEAAAAIRPLLAELLDDGIGQLHEIYEGDGPHAPRGCPAQAWSIAEVLRVLRLIETA